MLQHGHAHLFSAVFKTGFAQNLQIKFLHAHKLQVVPHLLQQVIEVPAVVGWDGHAVGHFVDDVKLLDRDLVYFIEHINARDVDPVEIRVILSVASLLILLINGQSI